MVGTEAQKEFDGISKRRIKGNPRLWMPYAVVYRYTFQASGVLMMPVVSIAIYEICPDVCVGVLYPDKNL